MHLLFAFICIIRRGGTVYLIEMICNFKLGIGTTFLNKPKWRFQFLTIFFRFQDNFLSFFLDIVFFSYLCVLIAFLEFKSLHSVKK